jgi:hypothetical protein
VPAPDFEGTFSTTNAAGAGRSGTRTVSPLCGVTHASSNWPSPLTHTRTG